MLASLPLYVFPLCMVVAAITDVWKFIIPNSLSIILVAAFFVSFFMSGLGFEVLQNHVLTGVIMLAVGIGLFAANICGAGDSKLLAAAALWLGWPTFGVALVNIAFIGGVLSIAIFLTRIVARRLPGLSLAIPPLARLAATDKLIAPYGVAIAAGAVYAFPKSTLFQTVVGGL